MATTRPKRKVVRALKTKGFEENVGKDHVVFFYVHDGKRTAVATKVSHSKKVKDIGARLLSKMARQCRLTKDEFLELVDCPLGAADYREKLQNDGHVTA